MQILETNLAMETFFGKLAACHSGALVLDYDGTLAPFTQDRRCAFPYPGVSQALLRIMKGGYTRVVIVTGRPASELIPLLGVFPFPEIWGLHGLERMRPDGDCRTYQLADSDLRILAEAGAWLDYQGLRHLAEFKTGSIAVHWRGFSPQDAAATAEKVRKGWSRLVADGRMTLLDFDGGIELRPNGRNKAHAVLSVMEELDPGSPLAYLGDDQTDEDAFSALKYSPRALTILVRPAWRETKAEAWIKPPQELLEFLQRWLISCGGAR